MLEWDAKVQLLSVMRGISTSFYTIMTRVCTYALFCMFHWPLAHESTSLNVSRVRDSRMSRHHRESNTHTCRLSHKNIIEAKAEFTIADHQKMALKKQFSLALDTFNFTAPKYLYSNISISFQMPLSVPSMKQLSARLLHYWGTARPCSACPIFIM